MTTSFLTLPLSSPIPGPIKRKRVLLLDDSTAKRELRAEAMRKLGVDVDCAADLSEARSWWRVDLYNLVLINMASSDGHLETFCDEIRAASPSPQLAFFVGKPEYFAHAPNRTDVAAGALETEALPDGVPETAPKNGDRRAALQWGIMAASRRISAVRSVSVARSMAMRNRPTPPRDLEVRASKRAEVMTQLASELQKKELL